MLVIPPSAKREREKLSSFICLWIERFLICIAWLVLIIVALLAIAVVIADYPTFGVLLVVGVLLGLVSYPYRCSKCGSRKHATYRCPR